MAQFKVTGNQIRQGLPKRVPWRSFYADKHKIYLLSSAKNKIYAMEHAWTSFGNAI